MTHFFTLLIIYATCYKSTIVRTGTWTHLVFRINEYLTLNNRIQLLWVVPKLMTSCNFKKYPCFFFITIFIATDWSTRSPWIAIGNNQHIVPMQLSIARRSWLWFGCHCYWSCLFNRYLPADTLSCLSLICILWGWSMTRVRLVRVIPAVLVPNALWLIVEFIVIGISIDNKNKIKWIRFANQR